MECGAGVEIQRETRISGQCYTLTAHWSTDEPSEEILCGTRKVYSTIIHISKFLTHSLSYNKTPSLIPQLTQHTEASL